MVKGLCLVRTFRRAVPFALALVAACSGGSSGASPGTTKADVEDFCGAYCRRASECSRDTDFQVCMRICSDALTTTISRLRSDAASSMVDCIAAADCRTVLQGETNRCIEEAAAMLAPTSATKRFCEAWEVAEERCGLDVDKAQCLKMLEIYSDETLDALGTCAAKPCAAMTPCLRASLGVTGF